MVFEIAVWPPPTVPLDQARKNTGSAVQCIKSVLLWYRFVAVVVQKFVM